MKTRLKNYIMAGYSGLYIVTWEEARVTREFAQITKELKGPKGEPFNLWIWSVTSGLVNLTQEKVMEETNDPNAMLAKISDGELGEYAIVLAKDFHMFLGSEPPAPPDPITVRRVKDVIGYGRNKNVVFVAMGCSLRMPPELEKEMTLIEYKLPDREELRIVVQEIAERAEIRLPDNIDPILDAASGLTTIEAADACSLSHVEKGGIDPAVISRIKADTVRKNGTLEIKEPRFKLEDIGGLDNLKSWTLKRRRSFTPEARKFGLPMPKGIVLVGIQGCGKSLSAEVMSVIFGCPLLQMDGGKIFGSLVGESERNVRQAIATAEAVAPCVLYVDEIDKAFSGSKSSGSTDGGTAARVLGTFLTWMNDKTAPVFVVATANDISQLPPEMLRKGRFDELWFVDLPDEEERKEIWKIQIRRYGRNPKDFDVDLLARNCSKGFSGAEIESLFVDSLVEAFDNNEEPTDLLISRLSGETIPLSETMAEPLAALRKWAANRARPASTRKGDKGGGRRILKAA